MFRRVESSYGAQGELRYAMAGKLCYGTLGPCKARPVWAGMLGYVKSGYGTVRTGSAG